MAEQDSKGGFNLPWMNLAAIFAVIAGGITALVEPIVSSRPALKPNRSQRTFASQNVNARLWQDPLRAAADAAEQRSQGHADEAAEDVRAELVRRIQEYSEPSGNDTRGKLLILPVLISGGPYAENTERRIRTRHAVISALGENRFAPQDGERIGYFYLPGPPCPGAEEAKTPDDVEKAASDFIVPFEQWREFLRKPTEMRAGGISEVIVLWVRDDLPDHPPLATLKKLAASLQWDPDKVNVRVLGPSSSDGLLKMSRELRAANFDGKPLKNTNFISPLATIPDGLFEFWSAPDIGVGPRVQLGPTLKAQFEGKIEGATFERTIFRDDQMLGELIEELGRRNFKSPTANPNGPYDGREGAIALVSEWDSLFGRSLPLSFAHQLKLPGNPFYDDLEYTPGVLPTQWVKRFFYLRGIDGRTPESRVEDQPKRSAEGEKSGGGEAGDGSKKSAPEERTEGEDQSDYLRRLSVSLLAQNEELKRDGRGGFKAIGVLGSDMYDKLMVLRALRKAFPGVLFFTTNLDARMTMREEWPACHNLIVASPFGLSVAPSLQGKIAPFRDGYQSAVFVGTQHLLRLDSAPRLIPADFFERTKPRIFEIGRSGAVDLSCDGGDPTDARVLQPVRPDRAGWWRPEWAGSWRDAPRIVAGLVLACLLILTLYFFYKCGARLPPERVEAMDYRATRRAGFGETARRNLRVARERSVVAVPVIVATAAAAVWIGSRMTSEDGEVFALMDGVSAWPSMGLQIVVGLLCVHFGFRAHATLRKNLRKVKEEFDLAVRIPPKNRGFWKTLRAGMRWKTHALRVRGRSQKIDARVIWAEYLARLSPLMRLLRSFPITVLVFACALALGPWFPHGLPPVRGVGVIRAMGCTFVVCTFLCTLLSFVCVDAIRLQRDFIRLFSRYRTEWPAKSRERSRRKNLLSPNALAHLLDIRLIGMRSEPVSKLIYYPFITSALLVGSMSSYFDDWSLPVGIIVLYSVNFACALYCALTLARAADDAREIVLKGLRRERLEEIQALAPVDEMAAVGAAGSLSIEGENAAGPFDESGAKRGGKDWVKTKLEMYDQTIGEVEGMRKGALAPIWEQPFVRAILYSTGSLGLGSLLQFIPHF